jgi:hypothetical protein
MPGRPNLRCPRNGKRMDVLADIPFPSAQATGFTARCTWEGDGNDPPARIPANEVAVACLRRRGL